MQKQQKNKTDDIMIFFSSKIAKLFNLNPFENAEKYEAEIFKQEKIKLKKDHEYFKHNQVLKDVEIVEIECDIPDMVEYANNNNCDFGLRNEKKMIEHLISNGFNVKKQQKIYKKDNIVGYIDGTINGNLYEFKSRKNKHGINTFEIVQLQVLMYLTGKKKIYILECCRGKFKKYRIDYDEEYVNQILKLIELFSIHYENCINKILT